MASPGSSRPEVKKPPSCYKIAKIGFITSLFLTVVTILYQATTNRVLISIRMPTFVNFTKMKLMKAIAPRLASLPGLSNDYLANRSVEVQRDGGRTYVVFKDMPDPCAKPRRDTGVEDLLCMKPLEFLSDYKNPCYKDGDTLRCMPYFHLFGICKTGTTDLFRRLYLHPDIIPNNGVLEKETWFWSWRRYTWKRGGELIAPITMKEFTNNFRANVIQKNVDKNGFHYKITGHGDPMDIWDRFLDTNIPQNNPEDKEMLWTSAFLVRKVNPDVKLLLMLRDPIERLYSMYFHWNLGKNSTGFHEYVAKDIPLWNHCIQQHTMRHCIYDKQLRKRLKIPLYGSFYLFHLKEWLRAFPRDQMLIMRNEDYSKDMKGTLTQIFTFLNVSLPDANTMQKMVNLKHYYTTERKATAGPMKEETRLMLTDLYREPTKQLGEFLQDNRFTFEDVSFG